MRCGCCRTCISWTGRSTPAAELREKQEIGEIESSKAESDLYAPIAGRLVEFNQELLKRSLGNQRRQLRSRLAVSHGGRGGELLSPEAYLIHLEAAWKIAERTIKGQMNE